MPRAANSSAGAVTSMVTVRTRCSRPLRTTFAAAMPESSGSISTNVTSTSGQRTASARPAAPTPAPNSITRSPGRAPVAAASRMASWPTRWPRFFWRDSQPPAEHRVVGRLRFRTARSGPQLVRQPRILQQLPRDRQVFLIDHDAARQHAERAFQHAHVLVQHHVRDFGALEQRLDRRDQHRIVGPDKLVHNRQPRRPSPAGARCARKAGRLIFRRNRVMTTAIRLLPRFRRLLHSLRSATSGLPPALSHLRHAHLLV